MASIILVLYLYFVTIHSNMENYFECLHENHMTTKDYMLGLKNNDPDARCILACTLEKDGVMIDGHIDGDAVLQHIRNEVKKVDQEKVSKIVHNCIADVEDESDRCTKANKMYHCTYLHFQKLRVKLYQDKIREEQTYV